MASLPINPKISHCSARTESLLHLPYLQCIYLRNTEDTDLPEEENARNFNRLIDIVNTILDFTCNNLN